jgi:5-methyltetrahydrofolate--homocysteine methyltransferase
MLSFLADSLAEAFSEETHKRLCPHGIRPAFGYPCCPDHNDKKIAFSLLQAEEKTGLTLTETSMIKPVSSICGMYFLNPASYYFSTGGKQRI